MPDHLTREQLQDVLQFAEALYVANNMGAWNPYMSNQLLQGLNSNPRLPSFDKIHKALQTYKESEQDLQGFTEFMSHFDMIFERTLYSYANTLAFDLSYVCTNAFTESDYQSEEYEADKRRVFDFLDKFKYQQEFRNVVVQCLKNETYFVWFRKTKWGNKGMKLALQVMPQDYCMLTGYWENGLLWDFDFTYFLQAGVDIEGYDPAIIKQYLNMFGPDGKLVNYRPTVPLNERTGEFAYWGQVSPIDGAWCFKFQTDNFISVPYLAPFLKDAIKNDDVAQLQYNKDMISAYGILAGEIRLFDNAKSGTVVNQWAIDPGTLGGFMAKAKAGLGELVKLAALPTENTKFYQFTDNNTDMYTDQLSTSAGVGSGVSRVIYSSDRMSAEEVKAGIIDQYNTVRPMYHQFENFLNFYVNQLTKKYHFKFTFDGCSYPFEREHRVDKIMKLADKGMVLTPSAYASAFGYRPQDFERMLQESKWSGWNQYWQLPLNASTTPGGSSGDTGGRPEKDDFDLSDSGEMNRDA